MNNNGVLAVTIQHEEHNMFEPSFRITEIGTKLHQLQAIVGGNIEMPFISKELSSMNIDIILNEEGKLEGLRPTVVLLDGDRIVDTLNGTVIFTSYDVNKESFISLTSQQVNFLSDYIRGNSMIYCDIHGHSVVYGIQLKSGF